MRRSLVEIEAIADGPPIVRTYYFDDSLYVAAKFVKPLPLDQRGTA
jgi:hypothetical protein